MVAYVKEAQHFEREIFNQYIAKCQTFYGGSMAIVYLTSSALVLGPVFSSSSFPFDVEYPFSVNNTLVYVVLFLQQCICAYQCCAHVCMSELGALLFWFIVARFDKLSLEFQESINFDTIIVCINKQIYLRK